MSKEMLLSFFISLHEYNCMKNVVTIQEIVDFIVGYVQYEKSKKKKSKYLLIILIECSIRKICLTEKLKITQQ